MTQDLLRLTLAGLMLTGSAVRAASAETVIYTFQGGNDGATPAAGVIADKAGKLYGTTQYGGGGNCSVPSASGCGTVFELSPPASAGGTWTETVLYSFQGGVDGASPGGLLMSASGSLYGTTSTGGPYTCEVANDCGTIFKLSPPATPGEAWTKTVIYNFPGGVNGFGPAGYLVSDGAGNLYGAAVYGGPAACPDCGVVFELSPNGPGAAWTETVLYNFKPFPRRRSIGDAQNPINVTFDDAGNLFGAAGSGGYCQQYEGGSCFGAVFELSPPSQPGAAWSETVLYRFGQIAQNPASGVVLGKSGGIYGTTYDEVFELVNGKANPILTFGPDTGLNGYPWAGVILDKTGNLFGATQGGTCCGVVFQLQRPAQTGGGWTETTLHEFAGSPDGELPIPRLTIGSDGALYGTTWRGGSQGCQYYGSVGCGTVFRVVP
jgi:uncharacterized repeat protein (TIGR03803 family)